MNRSGSRSGSNTWWICPVHIPSRAKGKSLPGSEASRNVASGSSGGKYYYCPCLPIPFCDFLLSFLNSLHLFCYSDNTLLLLLLLLYLESIEVCEEGVSRVDAGGHAHRDLLVSSGRAQVDLVLDLRKPSVRNIADGAFLELKL